MNHPHNYTTPEESFEKGYDALELNIQSGINSINAGDWSAAALHFAAATMNCGVMAAYERVASGFVRAIPPGVTIAVWENGEVTQHAD
jgi:hypothetical protein